MPILCLLILTYKLFMILKIINRKKYLFHFLLPRNQCVTVNGLTKASSGKCPQNSSFLVLPSNQTLVFSAFQKKNQYF